MNTLREVMNGLAIKRYHTKRTIREQTVADHSARIVAIICYLLDNPSGNLLKAAIYHDVSEFVTGDAPSPVKWNNPVLRQELNRISTEYEVKLGIRVPLTQEEAAILRFADYAEGCQYCVDELELGNRNMVPTLGRYTDALAGLPALGTGPIYERQMVMVHDYSTYLYSWSKTR